MKKLCLALCLTAIAAVGLLSMAAAQSKKDGAPMKAGNPWGGRWDLTITTPTVSYPDWMMIDFTDCCMQALIQPRSGSAVWVNNLKNDGSHLSFAFQDATWTMDMKGDNLTGTIKRGDGPPAQLSGVRAPKLARPDPAAWTTPEPIFNGKDLTGWEPFNPATNHWVVKDGELVNEEKGSNLKTTQKFDDFKLHIEFNCPDKGNSGVYLRGRYEVQVEYEPSDANDKYHSIGAIYSMLPARVQLPRTPGQWETFDITLIGRWVTVVRNGTTTIDSQEIQGITGGALDSNEGEPGPIYLQGDHTGGMKYRNITISVPKAAAGGKKK
jgi:3-keto-disaccharide hydrolase